MAVTAERFEQGLTYEAYKAQMTRNKDRLEENERMVDIDPVAVDAFQRLARPLNVRVFLRDQNLDLMNMYLNQGKFQSIPVFAFFDADFNPIAHLIERPATVTETMDRKRAEIFARNPDFGPPDQSPAEMSEDVRTRFMQEFVLARTEARPFANGEVQREFREIAEQAAA